MKLNTSTLTSERTEDRLMESTRRLVWNTQPSLGEPEEPSLVSPECLEVVPTDLVRPLSVTCVEREECSPRCTFGEDGIEEWISNKKEPLSLPPSLPQELFLWSWHADTRYLKSLNCLWLLTIPWKKLPKPNRLCNFWPMWVLTTTWKEWLIQKKSEPEKES